MRAYIIAITSAALGLTPLSSLANDLSSPGMDWADDHLGWKDDNRKSISEFGLRDGNGNVTFSNGFSGFLHGIVFDYGVLGSGTTDLNGNEAAANGGINVTVGGNILNVVTAGYNNTVIVDADQTNSGNQSSTIELNGSLTF